MPSPIALFVDVVLLFLLIRFLISCIRTGTERILTSILHALDHSHRRHTEHPAPYHAQVGFSSGVLAGTGFRVPLVTGGGVGGASSERDSEPPPHAGLAGPQPTARLPQHQHHHHHLQHTGRRHTPHPYPPPRHWIAVTEPRQSLEVPVYPVLVGSIRLLLADIAATPAVQRTAKMVNMVASALGVNEPISLTETPEEPDLTRMASLPQELITHILLLSASPSLSPSVRSSSPSNILLLSKQYYHLLLPKLYHTVSLHTAFAFRHFRLTLAVHNPSLGKLVRYLQIGSSQFDSSGYLPGQVAEHSRLAVGIEQLLLATPELRELSIDMFSLAALHTGTASRLERGCQPRMLCTELSIVPYLSLPTFEDVRQLELLVFSLDRQTALELRVALPRLESLRLRYVTRRRGDETFASDYDVDQFIDAIHLLRTWPDADPHAGKRLTQLAVFTWPDALDRIQASIPDAETIQSEARLRDFDQIHPHEPDTTPLYTAVDRGFLLGPRRGQHVLWRKARAHVAWRDSL